MRNSKDRSGLKKDHPLHTVRCGKHHMFLVWKHDLPWYKPLWKEYKPVKVCPLCVRLDYLTVHNLITDFQVKRWGRRWKKSVFTKRAR